MGKKEPIVERMETFERKQHCHAPCAINCQGILHQSSTDKVTNKDAFSYYMPFLFIAFPHSSPIKYLSQTC